MQEERVSVDLHTDLCFTNFYVSIENFNKKFGFIPNKLTVGICYIDIAKQIIKFIEPTDYEQIKDKINLEFQFELNKDFPKDYWEISGVKDNKKYILYSKGA